MPTNLLQLLEERGYMGRIVSIEHLRDLQGSIEAQYRQGFFDNDFYQERLTGFDFSPPESLALARSVIVVAVRQPQIRFTFSWQAKQLAVIVPPTYLHWQETDKEVEAIVAEVLGGEGYQVVQARLPKKLLAVRSGLAAYGRNNISYVEGIGSFHRLVALYSDLPWDEGEWQEPKLVARCQRCQACLRSCPTGAISAERFLLYAERCIVFHNEKSGGVLFPGWLDASWHNCLVGCMDCQRVCPENKGVLGWIKEGAEFSAEETALLLEGVSLDQLPAEMVRKLEWADLADMIDILPRNLRPLLERDR